MTPKAIEELFAIWSQENPAPTTELLFQTPFQCLIAVMLSAQATDVSVNKVTPELFKRAPDPHSMMTLDQAELESYIQSIGLYRSKAKHILETCHRLITQFDAQVPHTRQALESLPGVGRKTANVVLNTVFGEPTMAVDTHIFRVARRLGLSQGRTPLAVEKDLLACIPTPYRLHAHHWLILHGRYVCKARRPECNRCPIVHLCPSRQELSS